MIKRYLLINKSKSIELSDWLCLHVDTHLGIDAYWCGGICKKYSVELSGEESVDLLQLGEVLGTLANLWKLRENP